MAGLEELIKILRQVPLFSDYDRSQLRELIPIIKEEEYRPESLICRQGERGHRYYIVKEGALRVIRVDPQGRAQEVQQMEPGDSFGETSLLLGDVHDATIETIERSTLLYIERDDFEQLVEEHPDLENALRMRSEIYERRNYPAFSWLEKGEIPIKVLHKHAVVLLTSVLIPALLTVLVIIATFAARTTWGNWVLLLGAPLSLVPTLIALYLYIDWRNDLYTVTNRRVIHRERIGLTKERFAAVPLQAIQDIQQVQIGPTARIWEYGDLIMETAGAAGQVVFRSIPNPDQVRNLIFEQIERTEATARAEERAAIRKAMHRHFLDEEKGQPIEEEQVIERRSRQIRDLGCLMIPIRVLQYFLPPTWHRQGATVTWRKHWVALGRSVILPLSTFAVITGAVLYLTSEDSDLIWSLLFPYAVAVLIIIPWFLWQFENWQNDFYQVTTTRLIHVERLPFYLREERREASLDQITSVRFNQSLAGNILGFGNVLVETAATAGTFNLDMVSNPQAVQSEIFSHIESFRQRQRAEEAKRQRSELLDWFSVYDEIRETQASSSDQASDQEESV